MKVQNFTKFLNRPCKFRLKSGKLVYGVLWSVLIGEEMSYFFSTKGQYERMKSISGNSMGYILEMGTPVNLNDFISAEQLSEAV